VIETPGARGYGNPDARSKENLKEEAQSGKFSPDFLQKSYGMKSND
tara:strand:+ start:228 stop:365 length:138 start_codon:yes stop_codon:yes gene_type:complete